MGSVEGRTARRWTAGRLTGTSSADWGLVASPLFPRPPWHWHPLSCGCDSRATPAARTVTWTTWPGSSSGPQHALLLRFALPAALAVHQIRLRPIDLAASSPTPGAHFAFLRTLYTDGATARTVGWTAIRNHGTRFTCARASSEPLPRNIFAGSTEAKEDANRQPWGNCCSWVYMGAGRDSPGGRYASRGGKA